MIVFWILVFLGFGGSFFVTALLGAVLALFDDDGAVIKYKRANGKLMFLFYSIMMLFLGVGLIMLFVLFMIPLFTLLF